MRDLDHARMMPALAKKDFKALQGMYDNAIFESEIFGFHVEQAIEKSLKAWLSLIGVTYPKTHDLEELFALLADHGETVPEPFRSLQGFSDFAVQFRYEGFEDPEDKIDRPAVTHQVDEIIRYVEKHLQRP